MKPIFASQGLRSTHLLSTLGRLSQNFVIPAYRPLADLWSSAHLHYIIINQWEWLYYYLFEGVVPKTSVNWANTLKVSVNIVLLCLGAKIHDKVYSFLHMSPLFTFFFLYMWSLRDLLLRILIGRSHSLLHRIENNTVRTRNSDLICQGWRGEERRCSIVYIIHINEIVFCSVSNQKQLLEKWQMMFRAFSIFL